MRTPEGYGLTLAGKRSSRSTPTGLGSRGGTHHLPEYYRQWRANHPEYVARDNARRLRQHNLKRLENVIQHDRLTNHHIEKEV